MEEGHVVEPQRLGDRGIVLVARAADRVEALAARLQPARDPVELAAHHLAVEQLDHGLAGEADLGGRERDRAAGKAPAPHLRDELLVNGLGCVHRAPLGFSAAHWKPPLLTSVSGLNLRFASPRKAIPLPGER